MKLSHSVVFVALAGAFAVQAAEVEFFGTIDQGFAYLHEHTNLNMAGPAGQSRGQTNILDEDGYVAKGAKRSSFGQGTGGVSTWGLRGSEQINDDLTVFFHLENAFLIDSGELYSTSSFFERESSLGLSSKSYGEIKFGRMPALTTGSGTTGIFNSRVNPFSHGGGNMSGGWKFAGTLTTARYNNMINYKSPVFAGFQVHAQYSLGTANDENEGSSRADRWSAIGIIKTGSNYYLAAAVDYTDIGSKTNTSNVYNPLKVLVGGHYQFENNVKLYATAQYMNHVEWIGGYTTKEFAPMREGQVGNRGFEGYALSTGLDIPLWGGTFKSSIAYGWGENLNTETQNEYQRMNAGLGYFYPLSKRTSLYSMVGYFWQDADWQRSDIDANEVIVGITHRM